MLKGSSSLGFDARLAKMLAGLVPNLWMQPQDMAD